MRVLLSKIINRTLLPAMPGRYLLPFSYLVSVIGNDCETELKKLRQVIDQEGTGVAIDIGANQGHYAYVLSKMFRQVHAFEPNQNLTHGMSLYAGNIEIHNNGLSDMEGRATFFLPVVNGQELDGWASFSRGNCPDAEELVATEVDIATLDSFSIPEVAFMKIDVEGHESQVLRGAIETIRRCRPQVLIEIKRENEEAVFQFFETLQYRRYRLEDLVEGALGGRENYFFFPAEGKRGTV